MNAETLANMPPEDVSLASLAQGLGTVLGRLDGIENWRTDERQRAIDRARRNDAAHDETSAKLDRGEERMQEIENGQRELVASVGRIERLLTGDDPGSLPDTVRRITDVEKELGDDQRMRARWRGFWRDPVTLAIIGAILTLIVAPLTVVAYTALQDRGELKQATERSTASCNSQYRGIAQQRALGNYSAEVYADRILTLQDEGCPPPADVSRSR